MPITQKENQPKNILEQLHQNIVKPIEGGFDGLRKFANDALNIGRHLNTGRNNPNAKTEKSVGKGLSDHKKDLKDVGL